MPYIEYLLANRRSDFQAFQFLTCFTEQNSAAGKYRSLVEPQGLILAPAPAPASALEPTFAQEPASAHKPLLRARLSFLSPAEFHRVIVQVPPIGLEDYCGLLFWISDTIPMKVPDQWRVLV